MSNDAFTYSDAPVLVLVKIGRESRKRSFRKSRRDAIARKRAFLSV